MHYVVCNRSLRAVQWNNQSEEAVLKDGCGGDNEGMCRGQIGLDLTGRERVDPARHVQDMLLVFVLWTEIQVVSVQNALVLVLVLGRLVHQRTC